MHSKALLIVSRGLTSLVFIISAIAKLLSIDSFELYIFGFELLSLGGAFIAARLVIAFELALGISLAVNMNARFNFMLALATLTAFSVFLSILAVSGNKESCHCFGEFVSLNPVQSLIKNAVLISIMLPGAKLKSFRIRFKSLWYSLIICGSFSSVFIISPPDNWRYEDYSAHTTFNEEAFTESIENGSIPSYLTEGGHVVCFYSLVCPFCLNSAKKIATMRKMGTFSEAPITVIIGKGDVERDPAPFFEETKLVYSDLIFLKAEEFLRITNGAMPLILIMDEGKVIRKFCYRDIR